MWEVFLACVCTFKIVRAEKVQASKVLRCTLQAEYVLYSLYSVWQVDVPPGTGGIRLDTVSVEWSFLD